MPDDPQDDQAPRPALGQEQWLDPQPQDQPPAAPPPGTPSVMLRDQPKTADQPKPQDQPDDEEKPHAITGMGPGPGDLPRQHSVSDFVFNQFPTSVGNFVSNTFGAIRHPIDTVNGLGKLVSGGVQAAARAAGLDLPENEYDQVAQAFGHYISNRYGSVDKAKEALYTDPVGVMSDFSVVAGGVGGIADLANLAKTGEVLGTISKVANPMFLPGKLGKLGVNIAGHFIEKPPTGPVADWDAIKAQPEFDPRTKDVYPGQGQARTATQDALKAQKAQAAQQAQQAAQEQAAQAQQAAQQTAQEQAAQAQQAAQKAAAQQARQAAVKDRAYNLAEKDLGQGAIPGRAHWLQAEQDVPPVKEPPPPKPPKAAPPPKAAKPPKAQQPAAAPPPPPAAPPPAPPPTLLDAVKGYVAPILTGAGLGWAAEHFAHTFTGSAAAGALAGGAVKFLPQLLKTQAGQQMLMRLGPGSTAVQAAAVAKDMVPMLNAMYKASHPQEQIDLSQSPYVHARGGPVNHELMRVQRERLPLRGATLRSLHGG